MKKTGWNIILKLIIAVASAVAGVIGGQATRRTHPAKSHRR